jgi:hypothetical protein
VRSPWLVALFADALTGLVAAVAGVAISAAATYIGAALINAIAATHAALKAEAVEGRCS